MCIPLGARSALFSGRRPEAVKHVQGMRFTVDDPIPPNLMRDFIEQRS